MSVLKRWNGSTWEIVGPQIEDTRFNDISEMIAHEYDPTSTYNVGDYVVQSDKLYKCISKIESAEIWTTGHWSQIKITDEVNTLKSAIDGSTIQLEYSTNLGKGYYYRQRDGASASNSKYCRTNGMKIGYPYRRAISLGDSETYIYYLTFYDETGANDGTGYLGHGPLTSGITYIPKEAKKFGISIKRIDEASLTDDDVSTIQNAFVICNFTDKTLEIENFPADAKVTGDAISEVKSAFDNLKSAFEESLEYVEVPIPWHVSSSYPTGWTLGYNTGGIGSEIGATETNNYLRVQYVITNGGAGYYPAMNEALYIEVTPPSDKCARIIEAELDTSIITRIVGQINSTTYPDLQGVTQKIDVHDGYKYYIDIGRFSNDAPTYNTTEYVNGIKFRFVVAKKDETYKPDTSTGTQSNIDKRQFFTVTVDRPLAFGGEDTNTTTETVECVLQLPNIYKVEGDPVPLVLMCHGAHGYIQQSTGTWYNANWKTFCDALTAAGFALFDVNVLPSSTGVEQMGYCNGSPLAVNVAKAAYDYIVKNYNVQKKILVHGTSMGGVLASAFVKAYPELCLAQSSFAGRDFTQYLSKINPNTMEKSAEFALAYGYADFDALVADKFSHAEGLVPSLTLKKYNSGAVSIPPDRNTNFQGWLDFYAEIQSHVQADVVGEYTAYRSVPYKSWNSWADNEARTKAEQILQKAYAAGGSAPYLCVYYDSGTHTEMSYGQINNMVPQLIAWFNRWLH